MNARWRRFIACPTTGWGRRNEAGSGWAGPAPTSTFPTGRALGRQSSALPGRKSMLSPTTESTQCSRRINALRQAVQGAKPGVCTERAMIWTRYFKDKENRKK
ncbi:MAG: hypothetical protein CO013_12140, partial [Syntrophobacterales bacterium CG_4_8_14_3_um_filter_58_8]